MKVHPLTKYDIEKMKDLVKAFVSGTYILKKKDIQFLISNTSGYNPSSNQCNNESQPLGTYD